MRQQQGQPNRAHGQPYLPRVRLVRLESLSLEISYLGVKSTHLYKDVDCNRFN
uniref:Uncharacterized protein n=1 Tax=Arundo donax TaxID=35708 RepID=A0A0A9H6Z9_ARUDO